MNIISALGYAAAKEEKVDLRIHRDSLGSKKNCQRKEETSPKISDKRGKANSEDRHMGEFQ